MADSLRWRLAQKVRWFRYQLRTVEPPSSCALVGRHPFRHRVFVDDEGIRRTRWECTRCTMTKDDWSGMTGLEMVPTDWTERQFGWGWYDVPVEAEHVERLLREGLLVVR